MGGYLRYHFWDILHIDLAEYCLIIDNFFYRPASLSRQVTRVDLLLKLKKKLIRILKLHKLREGETGFKTIGTGWPRPQFGQELRHWESFKV